MISTKQRQRAAYLCEVMKEISGVDPMANTRKREVVNARMMVAQALYDGGCIETDIATLLGKTHCSIHHYRKKMETIWLPGYDAERELWEQFKQACDG